MTKRDYESAPVSENLGLTKIITGLASDLDELRAGKISVNDAIARSMLAKQIFNGVRIYMNGTKLLAENALPTPTPDELARALFTNDGVCSQYDWDNANEIARQWYRSLARAILPIVNARLDAVTKERDELRAKTLKVENCILCADECRGHSLGDSAAWEPEEGSRDWLNFHLVAAQEKLARAEGALEDIGIYGCGMLNQPAAMNGPEHLWLEKRIHRMEQVARDTLAELREPAAEEGRG